MLLSCEPTGERDSGSSFGDGLTDSPTPTVVGTLEVTGKSKIQQMSDGTKRLIIDSSVIKLESAKSQGKGLDSVKIHSKFTWIAANVFADNRLTEVKIPFKVTSIGIGAFENNRLTSLVIPDSVKRIGISAFFKNNLVEVILRLVQSEGQSVCW